MKEKVNRFERILKTRVKFREEEQLLLSDQKSEEDRLLSCLDALRSEKECAVTSFCMQQRELLTPQEMWFQRKSIDVIEKRICDGDSSLCDVRQEIEATEIRLLEKHREVQIMEKYISFMLDELKSVSQKNEQAEMDDIAGIRFGPAGRRRNS
jgi:flagellar export protein FliJ